jgi:hypothetical protein
MPVVAGLVVSLDLRFLLLRVTRPFPTSTSPFLVESVRSWESDDHKQILPGSLLAFLCSRAAHAALHDSDSPCTIPILSKPRHRYYNRSQCHHLEIAQYPHASHTRWTTKQPWFLASRRDSPALSPPVTRCCSRGKAEPHTNLQVAFKSPSTPPRR